MKALVLLLFVSYILFFINKKVGRKVFNEVIAGFQIEPRRFSYSKSYHEFSRIVKNDKVLFIDDMRHPGMIHPNVTYLNVEPYEFNLPYDTMCKRFIKKYKNLKCRCNDFKNKESDSLKDVTNDARIFEYVFDFINS